MTGLTSVSKACPMMYRWSQSPVELLNPLYSTVREIELSAYCHIDLVESQNEIRRSPNLGEGLGPSSAFDGLDPNLNGAYDPRYARYMNEQYYSDR
jgi:hypothetical protein